MSIIKLSKLLNNYEKSGRYAEADNLADIANYANMVSKFLADPKSSADQKINLINLGKTFLSNQQIDSDEKSEINNLLLQLEMKQNNI